MPCKNVIFMVSANIDSALLSWTCFHYEQCEQAWWTSNMSMQAFREGHYEQVTHYPVKGFQTAWNPTITRLPNTIKEAQEISKSPALTEPCPKWMYAVKEHTLLLQFGSFLMVQIHFCISKAMGFALFATALSAQILSRSHSDSLS